MGRRTGRGGGHVGGGRLQALEVAEQPAVGLSLEPAVGQEGDGLPQAAGVAIATRGRNLLLLLLLPGPQVGHGHLQDVRLLLLGVGLLPVEFGPQQGLELLDAGVDAVSPQFLHHWFSQLNKEKKEKEL